MNTGKKTHATMWGWRAWALYSCREVAQKSNSGVIREVGFSLYFFAMYVTVMRAA